MPSRRCTTLKCKSKPMGLLESRKIRQQLRFVYWEQRLHTLEFHNYQILNQQVYSKPRIEP